MQRALAEGGAVRVSRNGNSQTLAIPAEVAEREQIEAGETFYVEAGPEGLFYRRAKGMLSGRRFVGEGAESFLALPPRAGLPAGEDPAPLGPIDWDY